MRPTAYPPLRAVIFDLDGTLVDSAPDLAFAANRMLAALGAPARDPALLATFIGKGIPRLVERALAGSLEGEADAALLARCPKLKAVCNIAVGFNNIDLQACTERGVMATNTPGVLDDSTADFTWALGTGIS